MVRHSQRHRLHEPGHYKLATAHMMLLPGVPCLYYGDELGMEGRPGEGDDPACGGDDAMRRPMLSPVPDDTWPWCATERLAITEQLIQIKKQNKAFQVCHPMRGADD
jgi:glycosidase